MALTINSVEVSFGTVAAPMLRDRERVVSMIGSAAYSVAKSGGDYATETDFEDAVVAELEANGERYAAGWSQAEIKELISDAYITVRLEGYERDEETGVGRKL